MQIHKPWTKEEIALLKREYPKVGATGLAERLGRKCPAISKKAESLGIRYRPKKVYVDNNGYLQSYETLGPRQYKKFHIHRRVMEKKLGRPLRSDEIIHHKNGDKTDNRLSNLMLMTRAEHINEHRADLQEKQHGKSKI